MIETMHRLRNEFGGGEPYNKALYDTICAENDCAKQTAEGQQTFDPTTARNFAFNKWDGRSSKHLIPESRLQKFAEMYPPYLKERGISEQTASDWGVRVHQENGRVIFPIRRRDGGLVGYMARSVKTDSSSGKYINTPFSKAAFLFGENKVNPERKHVVLTEGVFDALHVYQAGYNGCAVLGSYLTKTHAETLLALQGEERFEKIVILMDSDSAGRKGAERALMCLSSVGLESVVVRGKCPEGKDPADLSRDELIETIEGALNQNN